MSNLKNHIGSLRAAEALEDCLADDGPKVPVAILITLRVDLLESLVVLLDEEAMDIAEFIFFVENTVLDRAQGGILDTVSP